MNPGRKSLAGLTSAVIAGAVLLSAAAGAHASEVMTLKGFDAPGTPAQYNKVKVVKQGPKSAERILVLVPGTSAGATNFGPLSNGLLAKLNKRKANWQIWSIERRENLLEDHSYLQKYMKGEVTNKERFDHHRLRDMGLQWQGGGP